MLFIPVMAKLNFQKPLLQSSMLHDPVEIDDFINYKCFTVISDSFNA